MRRFLLRTRNQLRRADILLRSVYHLLRASNGVKSHGVRSVGLSATPCHDDAAPYAANRTARPPANRRKYSGGAEPGAHCAEPVVRTLVGKRADAHYEGPIVRMCAI